MTKPKSTTEHNAKERNAKERNAKERNTTEHNATAHKDDAWVKEVTDQLRQSEDTVDYVVESKLAAARARAVAETPANQIRQRLHIAGTAIAGVALCYLAIQLFQPSLGLSEDPSFAQNNMQLEQSIDLPILSSTEDLEFFDSLDFIEWMDKQDLTSG